MQLCTNLSAGPAAQLILYLKWVNTLRFDRLTWPLRQKERHTHDWNMTYLTRHIPQQFRRNVLHPTQDCTYKSLSRNINLISHYPIYFSHNSQLEITSTKFVTRT